MRRNLSLFSAFSLSLRTFRDIAEKERLTEIYLGKWRVKLEFPRLVLRLRLVSSWNSVANTEERLKNDNIGAIGTRRLLAVSKCLC